VAQLFSLGGIERTMKIDYPNIENPDGLPFVRIYEFQRADAQKLKQTFEALASESLHHIKLQDVITVESVDGTELEFARAATDRGMKRTGAQHFDFVMSSEGWRHVAGLTDVFCQQSYLQGFQWLGESSQTKIELLLSPSGDW
jgi:hypothetical protein